MLVQAVAHDDIALAQTILRGVRGREERVISMHGTVTHAWFLGDAERHAGGPMPAGLLAAAPPEAPARPPRSLTLLEFWCVPDHLRLDSAALVVGRNVGSLPYRLQGQPVLEATQRVVVRGTNGPQYVRSDHMRSMVLRDGEKHMVYSSQRGAVIVQPQEWYGPVASAPVVSELTMLGSGGGRTFGSVLDNLLAVTGVVKRHTVAVKTVDRTGHKEYQLAISIVSADDGVADYLLHVAPHWGYAVTGFESKVLTSPALGTEQWGTGYVYAGEDFREMAPGVWMPFKTLRERYEYAHDTPPWRETWETKVLDLEVNATLPPASFCFTVPPGVVIVGASDPVGWAHLHSAHVLEQATRAADTFASRALPTVGRVLNAQQ